MSLHKTVPLGVAALLLGFSGITVTSYAQDSEGASPPGARDADTGLAARVKQSLHSDKTFDDKHINVTVEHGEVVLNGFVQDNREQLTAERLATKAADGHKVVDHLSIKQNYPNAP